MKKLAFFCESLKSGSPAQQLLDRFLLGWPSDGKFVTSPFEAVAVQRSQAKKLLEDRQHIERLAITQSMAENLQDAEAWVVVSGKEDHWTCCSQYNQFIQEHAPKDIPGWIVGLPVGAPPVILEPLFERFGQRIQAGTPLPWTWRLPEVDITQGGRLKEAIVLVRGAFPNAEQEGIDTLLALTSHRQGGESGVSDIRYLEGDEVWKAAREGLFSWEVFAAAVSRTNSKLGDATVDGRTQDIVGLGMIQRLAKGTRAWLLQHHDGLKTCLITMDGVLNDDNFAVQLQDGAVFSAQLYRPPKPNDHQYSRLAARMVSFFSTGNPALPPERTLLWAGLAHQMQQMHRNKLKTQRWNQSIASYTLPQSTWTP